MNGLLSKKINELVSTLKGSNINENVALARIKELFPSEEFKHEFIENSTDFYIEDKETIRLSSDNETKIVISYPEGDRLGNSLANSDTDIWIEYLDNDRIEKIPLFEYKQVNEHAPASSPASAPSFQKDIRTKRQYSTAENSDTDDEAYWLGEEFRKGTPLFPRSLYNNLPDLLNDCIIEDGSEREQDVALLSDLTALSAALPKSEAKRS